jgi:hypothetical protein
MGEGQASYQSYTQVLALESEAAVLRHTWAAREAAFRKACAELRASRGEVVFNEIVRPSIALPYSVALWQLHLPRPISRPPP